MRANSFLSKLRAFTLIELLVVIAIIAVLARTCRSIKVAGATFRSAATRFSRTARHNGSDRKDVVSSYLGRGEQTGLLLSGGIGFSGRVAKRAEPSQYAPATLRRMEGAPSSMKSQ